MLNKLKENAGLAGLIVAMLALFVALSGIAGALPGKKSIDKNDLKKNVVASKNVGKDALTGADIKESTLDIPAAALPRTTFGVTSNASGGVEAATLSGTTVNPTGGGGYTVTFPRDLKGCVPVATDNGVPVAPVRTTLVAGNSSQVFVLFADSNNSSFNLVLTCP